MGDYVLPLEVIALLLTAAMMLDLAGAFARAQADRSLKAVALAAEGKAFSAGADVGEHRPEQAPEMIAAFSRMFRHLGALELPIVMTVDGAALGAGFELAMMGDVVLASDRAKFGELFVLRGLVTDICGLGRLAQLVAICDVYTWKLLRRDAGLDRPTTERAILEMLRPLLGGT